MLKGSYTVESVFVLTICIWVMFAVMYGGMYVHDRIAMETVVNEMAYSWLASSQPEKAGEWKKGVEKTLKKKLYLFRVKEIKEKRTLRSEKITVRYSLPVSWKYMKKILVGDKKYLTYETVREIVEPEKYMWDAEVIRGVTGK